MMDNNRTIGFAETTEVFWSLFMDTPPDMEECNFSTGDNRFLLYWTGLNMPESLLTEEERSFVEAHIAQCPSCQHDQKMHLRIACRLPLLEIESVPTRFI